MRIAFIFDHLGPYHIARMEAAGRKAMVTAIEVAGRSADYAWSKVEKTKNIERRTLFHDDLSANVSAARLNAKLRALLVEISADVVAIPGWSDRAALVALKWCIETNTPVVVMSDSTLIDARRYWLK